MAESTKPARAPSKMSKSEITSVRLDPKLRYLAELAARKQRRSLSSYIEWAVEKSLEKVDLYTGTGYNSDESVTVFDASGDLWDVDESERFVRLAIRYPELLTHEEQERWKMLGDSGLLHAARNRTRTGQIDWDWSALEDKVFPELRLNWTGLLDAQSRGPDAARSWVRVVAEEIEADGATVHWAKNKPANKPTPGKAAASGFDDMDDDIPF